jgi:hypothetical protein
MGAKINESDISYERKINAIIRSTTNEEKIFV